jgi:hypothetical protein
MERPMKGGGGLLGGATPNELEAALARARRAPLPADPVLDPIFADADAHREREQAELDRQEREELFLEKTILPRFGKAIRRIRAVREGKAARTALQYENRFDRFRDFCVEVGLEALPAETVTVAGYLIERLDAGASAQVLRDIKAAIRWRHRQARLPDPTDDEIVDAILAEAPKKPTNGHAHVNGH